MSLILAAALAAATPAPVTTQEVENHVVACLALAFKRATAEQVVVALNLNTEEKARAFILGCKMFVVGVDLGRDSMRPRT